MECWPVISKRYPARVSYELRDTLLEFTINCLLEQPAHVAEFAKQYFDDLLEQKTEIVQNEEIAENVIDFPEGYERKRTDVIFSESYNPAKDTDDDGADPFYEKTPEQRALLLSVVPNCLLFRALDKEQISRVIDVMFPKEVKAGDVIIKQFDDGDNFYVIENGLFDVLIASGPEEEPVHVHTYQNTGTFGELALMYNMPRAATIKAQTDGKLWAMDRITFRRIVLKATFRKRKKYEELISKVPILTNITPYEKMVLADALIPKEVSEGEEIIRQDDQADGMYFIESGNVRVVIYEGETTFEVSNLGEDDYFGELALITHKPRAASVIASTNVKLAFLDKETFERILGPCKEIMERNIEVYQTQLERAKNIKNDK